MSLGEENRRSFRIVESTFISYDIVSDLDCHQGFERWKMSQGTDVGVRSKLMDIDARFAQKLFLLKSDSVALAECMMLLNEKMSTVIDELPAFKASKAALAKSAPRDCEIGADGMLFPVERSIEPDTKLALRFLLASDNRYVETFCRVIRNEDSTEQSDTAMPHKVAVEFLGMKSEQKDILIQHLFDRESETLRMRRLRIDEEEFSQTSE